MQRLPTGKSGQRVGGVLDATLPDIELAELLEDTEFVATAHRGVHVARYRLCAFEVGQADADDAKRIVEQLAVGAAEGAHVLQLGLVALRRPQLSQLLVQHDEKNFQGVVESSQLEQRPAPHIPRPLAVGAAAGRSRKAWVVRRCIARQGTGGSTQYGGEGHFGLQVVAGGKQHFTAAEVGLIGMHRSRVLLHQLGQCAQGRLKLTTLLLRARQLVQHAVAARVARVGLEQFLVERDRGSVVWNIAVAGGGFARAAVCAVHLQVAQTTQGLGALGCIGRCAQKLAVSGDGLLGGHRPGRVWLVGNHSHDAIAQRRQRGFGIAGQARIARTRHQPQRGSCGGNPQASHAHAANSVLCRLDFALAMLTACPARRPTPGCRRAVRVGRGP